MYTAAEALRLSTTGKIRHINDKQRTFFFDAENKVWKEEWECAVGEDYSIFPSKYFSYKNFLPVMAEKSELEKAKEKYLGKWVKVKGKDLAYIVTEVIDGGFLIDVIFVRGKTLSEYFFCKNIIDEIEPLELEPSNNWGKGRCCVEDAPTKDIIVHVKIKLKENVYEATIQSFINNEWQNRYKPKKGDLWWALPEVEG